MRFRLHCKTHNTFCTLPSYWRSNYVKLPFTVSGGKYLEFADGDFDGFFTHQDEDGNDMDSLR